MVLLAELKTSDTKYIAIEEAKKLIEERKQQLKTVKNKEAEELYKKVLEINLTKRT